MYFNYKFSLTSLFLLFIFFLPNVAFCSQDLSLSIEEREWVSRHQEIVVANEIDWPPFDFAEGATPQGYSIDLIKLVAKKTGLNVSFVNGLSWEELLTKFKNKEIDILPAIFKTKERSSWIAFTSSYAQNPSVLIVEKNNFSIKDIASLKGRKIAVIPGYATAQAIETRFPEIIRVSVENPSQGVIAVATGEVDAFIGSLGVISYVSRQNYISNIKNVGEVAIKTKEETELHIGVLKDNILLRNILQKGLDTITPAERDQLHQKWFPASSVSQVEKTSQWSKVAGPMEYFIYIPPFLLALFLVGYLFMFKRLRLNIMLTLTFIFIISVAITITSTIAYQTAKESLEKESYNKLTAVREMKAGQLEDYYRYISDQALTFSEDKMIVDAMKSFTKGFEDIDNELNYSTEELLQNDIRLKNYYQEQYLNKLNPNLEEKASIEKYWPGNKKTKLLQQLYIANNPYETGYKLNQDHPGDNSNYSKTHQKFHPVIRNYLEKFGYYDIFLVDSKSGHIVYSVFKEVDFATSLLDGPYKNTNIADVFRSANTSQVPHFIKNVDYQPYHPSYNEPASFVASPIFDGKQKIGVLIFQMPIDKINEIMTNKFAWSEVGLGTSGETYLVGPDYLLRNQSRFFIEDSVNYFKMISKIGLPPNVIARIRNLNTTIGLQPVKTLGTEAALKGESGTKIFADYRGIEVLSAYKPLHLEGLQWAIMSEIDKDEAFAYVYFLKNVISLCYIIIILLIVIVVHYVSRHITRPLKGLTDYANELAEHDFSLSSHFTSPSHKITSISETTDEVGDLARAFLHMETELDLSIKDLITTTAVKERMEGELNIGRDIQMSMLPLIFPAFPDRREIDVHASLKPAREVGGDFYDFYFIDEERFCFCVGDVSGKGVPAALFMAITKTLIKSRATEETSTASIITRVNDELSSDNPSSMFVTFFIGILNVNTGEVVYTNAGHNPPYVKRKNGSVEKISHRHGLVLGAMDGMTYGENSIFLTDTETIFLYTDGVTEAMNLDEQLYSDDRLEKLLQTEEPDNSQALVESVMASVHQFEKGAEQADDITILALRYTHMPDTEIKKQLKLVAKNDFSEIERINENFSVFAEENNIPKPLTSTINMVFDELLNNTITYAFKDNKEHEIEINIEVIVDRLSITLSDNGIPFNPFTTKTPDTDLSVEERGVGGLGIHLVKNIMDEVHYKRHIDRNIVTVVKNLESTK